MIIKILNKPITSKKKYENGDKNYTIARGFNYIQVTQFDRTLNVIINFARLLSFLPCSVLDAVLS